MNATHNTTAATATYNELHAFSTDQFEATQTYIMSWTSNSQMKTELFVTGRTAKFVTFENQFGEVTRCKVHTHNGTEWAMPTGTYANAPVVRSTDVKPCAHHLA